MHPRTIPSSGSWDEFNTTTTLIDLPAGEHIVRFNVEARGFDLDKIEFAPFLITGVLNPKSTSVTVCPNPSSDGVFHLNTAMDYQVFNSVGAVVVRGQGKVVDLSAYPQGIYHLRTNETSIKLIQR